MCLILDQRQGLEENSTGDPYKTPALELSLQTAGSWYIYTPVNHRYKSQISTEGNTDLASRGETGNSTNRRAGHF